MGELNPNALLEDEVELEVKHRKEVAVAGLFRWLRFWTLEVSPGCIHEWCEFVH